MLYVHVHHNNESVCVCECVCKICNINFLLKSQNSVHSGDKKCNTTHIIIIITHIIILFAYKLLNDCNSYKIAVKNNFPVPTIKRVVVYKLTHIR